MIFSTLTENHEILNSSHKFEIPASMNTEKFMDDATCQEVIYLSTALASNIDRSGPLPFWESSGEVLPAENSLLQNKIITIKKISDIREIKFNSKKTCLFIVIFLNNHQFKHLLKIPGKQDILNVVQ